jgi:hypothetical protein
MGGYSSGPLNDYRKENGVDWFHKVDKLWLEERRGFLTASDIYKIIPYTPSGRPRANLNEAMLKIWGSKQCVIDENDTESRGVMARGHLLEPWAIDEFNRSQTFPTKIHHWDDCLIFSRDDVAFSPDGMDVPREDGLVAIGWSHSSISDLKRIVEVKSYGGEAHYMLGMSTKLVLEERWQLATAMYVAPQIESAALAFFNPRADHPLFIHTYERSELEMEIELVKKAVEDYKQFIKPLSLLAEAKCPEAFASGCIREDQIIEILEKAADDSRLNP